MDYSRIAKALEEEGYLENKRRKRFADLSYRKMLHFSETPVFLGLVSSVEIFGEHLVFDLFFKIYGKPSEEEALEFLFGGEDNYVQIKGIALKEHSHIENLLNICDGIKKTNFIVDVFRYFLTGKFNLNLILNIVTEFNLCCFLCGKDVISLLENGDILYSHNDGTLSEKLDYNTFDLHKYLDNHVCVKIEKSI